MIQRPSLNQLTLTFLVMFVSYTNSFAPIPFKIFEGKYFIYLDLKNSNPETFRYQSRNDLSKSPDIL